MPTYLQRLRAAKWRPFFFRERLAPMWLRLQRSRRAVPRRTRAAGSGDCSSRLGQRQLAPELLQMRSHDCPSEGLRPLWRVEPDLERDCDSRQHPTQYEYLDHRHRRWPYGLDEGELMTQCPAIRSGAVTKVTGGALRIAPTKSSGHNASTDHGGGKRQAGIKARA
jgi:hypothetical protein